MITVVNIITTQQIQSQSLKVVLNSSSKTMDEKGLIIERSLFKTTDVFNIAAIGICGILAVLYGFFW